LFGRRIGDVRNGSKADIGLPAIDVRFTPKSGIRKPFSQRLLTERVKVVLRRSSPKDGSLPKEADSKVLERGQLRMDPERHTRTWKNEQVTLTVTEFLILQALASRPGVVKSRNALMDAIRSMWTIAPSTVTSKGCAKNSRPATTNST
jgi:hypothetical protein